MRSRLYLYIATPSDATDDARDTRATGARAARAARARWHAAARDEHMCFSFARVYT